MRRLTQELCVPVSDYDALAAANADLQLHFDTLKADRDQQYDMKVKAREQRDAVTADNQRLREALEHIRAMQLRGFLVLGDKANGLMQAALTTANGEGE
jgi:FtsZ-binding cell division protein ZapB